MLLQIVVFAVGSGDEDTIVRLAAPTAEFACPIASQPRTVSEITAHTCELVCGSSRIPYRAQTGSARSPFA